MKMTCMLRTVLVASLMLVATLFAGDIVATTSNGETVILHDNGKWEFYKNNKNVRDVRPSAVPEDAKFNVSVTYENAEKIKKNIRLAMEADFATEEEIKDSLRKVPKGGLIYFQVPSKQIKKGLAREFTYSIYDGGKTPIFTKTVPETDAVPSEIAGTMDLLVVPVYGRVKSKSMKAIVENKAAKQTLEIEIPIQ